MKAGYLLAVEGCLPSALGVLVEVGGGKIKVTDCPFSEAKEVIGGLAVYQVASRQEAIDHAKAFLELVGDGECELRQLFEEPKAPMKEPRNPLRRERFARSRPGEAGKGDAAPPSLKLTTDNLRSRKTVQVSERSGESRAKHNPSSPCSSYNAGKTLSSLPRSRGNGEVASTARLHWQSA